MYHQICGWCHTSIFLEFFLEKLAVCWYGILGFCGPRRLTTVSTWYPHVIQSWTRPTILLLISVLVYFNIILPSIALSPGLLIGLFLLKLCLPVCHLWHAHYVPSITSSLIPPLWYYLMKGANYEVCYAVSSSVTSSYFRVRILFSTRDREYVFLHGFTPK